MKMMLKCVKPECENEALESDLYCQEHLDVQKNAAQYDFLCRYRGGSSFKVAAKHAQVTTTQVKDWAINDESFAKSMKQIHEERIFEAKQALIESLPDVIAALIVNAKCNKGLSIAAARLVFQAAGVKLPEPGRPKVSRAEMAEPSKEEIFPEIEPELDPDDTDELADIAKGIK